AVLVAYQAQLDDREPRGDSTPQDAVVENRERRGAHALPRGLGISRRNERAYDRRHTGFRGGGDQAGERVLEFIGGRSQRVQCVPEQHEVPDNIGRVLFFLKGIRCHVVLLWTGWVLLWAL